MGVGNGGESEDVGQESVKKRQAQRQLPQANEGPHKKNQLRRIAHETISDA